MATVMNKSNALKLFHNLYENDKSKTIWISSPFGYRINPITGKKGEFHNGVDYSAQGKSVPCYAIEDGTVLNCGTDISGAKFVYVYFPKLGMVGLYYHLASISVKKNQKVNASTKIGMLGKTGNATGIHLHFSWFKYADYSKSMNNRTYYDYNTYVFPSDKVGTPVQRNENVNQIEVTATVLNGRKAPSLKGTILGYVNVGIYNILQEAIADGYTWYEIEKDLWIAYNKDWENLLPKKESEIDILKKENEALKKKNDELNKQVTSLQNRMNQINNLSKM